MSSAPPPLPPLHTLRPALARPRAAPPIHGGPWLYELKLDGYRALAGLERGRARIISRSQVDWTARFPRIRRALEALPADGAVFDGELCALDARGHTRFQALQAALSAGDDAALQYFIFDLLFAQGVDVRARPLRVRRAMLAALIEGAPAPLRSVSAIASCDDVGRAFAALCRQGVEGVVAKRAEAPYRPGRGGDWVKVKCARRQELVIAGYTSARGGGGLGALLLAVNGPHGLRYAGKVGTGFSEAQRSALVERLAPLRIAAPAILDAPRLRGVSWVRPEQVCEVRFTEWTADGRLRQPSFLGLREDKPAREVVRERPAGTAVSSSAAGVAISHPERVIDSTSGVTKLELARYFEAVSCWLLPYAAGRPLALVRCPEGVQRARFFQKRRWAGAPASIQGGPVLGRPALRLDEVSGLVACAQFGGVELHGWGATWDDAARPDWLVLDLDPDEDLPFARVVDAARTLRALLTALGLESFVKTTGGKGLHLVAPLDPASSWPTLRAVTRALAEHAARLHPARLTAKAALRARAGRVFIDHLRNGPGATAVLPYVPRARRGLPVAMPIRWSELPHVDPHDFTVRTVPGLLRRRADPWARFFAIRQALPAALANAGAAEPWAAP